MDIGYVLFTGYLALGIFAGFIYERKKLYVLWGAAGGAGLYATAVFAGVSLPQLDWMLISVGGWLGRVGTGGLGLPIGAIVGQDFARRLG